MRWKKYSCLCSLGLAVAALPVLPARAQTTTYAVAGPDILVNGQPTVWGGVNAMFVYGGSASSMTAWNIGMVREPLPDLSETPISGGTIQGSDGSYLHSLQDIADDNRANGKITIFCPFQWQPGSGQFAGLVPSTQPYYQAYKTKMQQIAEQFIDQPDVWLKLWNEPYADQNDPLWLSDAEDMVDNIRATGNTNIILVPGDNWGSSEDVILSHGETLLEGRQNLIFDLHAYDWEPDTQANSEERIRNIRSAGFALIFGEAGPGTSSGTVDPTPFLKAALHQEVSTLAWYWNFSDSDPNALFTSSGQPNNSNNFNWAATAQSFLTWIGGSGTPYAANDSLRQGAWHPGRRHPGPPLHNPWHFHPWPR